MVEVMMELQTLENRPKIITIPEILIKRVARKNSKLNASKPNPVFADIIGEAGQDVFDYLERSGIIYKPNVLFLSYTRHYLYDAEDLKEVGSILNFRLINRMTHVRHYFHTINRILSDNGYYAGCFLDYKNQRQVILNGSHSMLGRIFLFFFRFINRIIPRVPLINKVQLLLNQGKTKCITSNELKELLTRSGFQMVDMEEIDGLTYFIARKSSHSKHKSISVYTLLNHFKTKTSVINI